MSLIIMTLSIMAFIIITLSITSLSIMALISITLRIKTISLLTITINTVRIIPPSIMSLSIIKHIQIITLSITRRSLMTLRKIFPSSKPLRITFHSITSLGK
jgi:hypothetical protein